MINSFIIPVELSFEPEELSSVGFLILDNALDVLFFIDIVLMFFTTYLSKQGQEIFESNLIAVNYMKTSRFFTDILSLLGANVITQFSPRLRVLGFFKMARVRRLNSYIKKLNLPENLKAVFLFVRLTFYLVLWIHIQGCIWW
eukprot:CAMPEP_0170511220 /NCGR_PEP_ID=MMETSP0208-20121228/66186_1 /TAXON_ID=197538 /ORGANISM="Strombidium inclinatum, Strain S3" /LENGTH=142 /DNA_ID=CAMNT_0010794743 /DNA_START=817 /DNA_END=1242 /DNA_ORIENTATION=-